MASPAFVSVFDMFSLGVGPSSSHTVGPMRAARHFANGLVRPPRTGSAMPLDPPPNSASAPPSRSATELICTLFGSLAATGPGHRTPQAIVAGLNGQDPETTDLADIDADWERWREHGTVQLGGANKGELRCASGDPDPTDSPDAAPNRPFLGSTTVGRTGSTGATQDHPYKVKLIAINLRADIVLERHVNGLRLEARDATGTTLAKQDYFSIGGGFIETTADVATPPVTSVQIPYPYSCAAELLDWCAHHGLGLADVALANEAALRPGQDIAQRLGRIWQAMADCVAVGLDTDGVLPGELHERRRAGRLAVRLRAMEQGGEHDTAGQWLQAYAMAVGEVNAAGGRVVTAPTNGAAGIVPAVLTYALRFANIAVPRPEIEFLLVAGLIGGLYKRNASISGAEAGCQGEIGVACSMAAAGLAHLLGGTPWQVENAAEIAMEQNLGLTCDPVGGLVQLPCIERNAIAAGTAVSAARLALCGDGAHRISLDTVIETMRQTGIDMSAKYKETAQAGLAVNVVEC